MSANNSPNESEVNKTINNNNNINTDNINQSVRPKNVTNDTLSLKSETSCKSRPLKFGHKDCKEDNEAKDQINENQFKAVYNACEETADQTVAKRSSRFPTIGQCSKDSQDEQTVCCANVAINLYNKALESAKRALPNKSKARQQFPRSFGEDFESLGPEGFNYLDDGQTECSYDYKDIEFNRDSMFRPDVLAQTDSGPVLIDNSTHEPTNLSELQSTYGLPEEADRVQPYDPSKHIGPQNPSTSMKATDSLKADSKSEAKSEVAINKDSESTADTSDMTTNTVEAGIIVKSRISFAESVDKKDEQKKVKPIDPKPTTASTKSDTKPTTTSSKTDPKPTATSTKTDPKPTTSSSKARPAVVSTGSAVRPTVIEIGLPLEQEWPKAPEPKPSSSKSLKAPEIQIERCDSVAGDSLSPDMEQLAKRTSQLIMDTAFDTIAKQKADSYGTENQKNESKSGDKQSKKSSTESSKELVKKERKLLEKKLKEEEKVRRRQEKESKDYEKKERKRLFDRFRTDDKQKQKIIKKQKQFEKIRKKSAKHSAKSGQQVDNSEADDEYEPTGAPERPYEDIDDEKVVIMSKRTANAAIDGQPVPECVAKFECIENIREIGVTYVPSDDGIENENYIEEPDPKVKPRISSFRMPRIESFKTKVKGIFPKKTAKESTKMDKTPKIITGQQSDEPISGGQFIAIDPSVGSGADKCHEYENIPDADVELKQVVTPSITVHEVMGSQYEETEEEDRQFIERISRVDSPKTGAKKRKKSKTRAKLDRFTAKAIESLPKISAISTKVKGLVSNKKDGPQHKDHEYERFVSEHQNTEQRLRYDPDYGCVSDSELCDSLRRSGAMGRHHVYEEMAATQERLDAYMSPVSGPLRPPRRFSSLKNLRSGQKVASVPSLATQVLLIPKRMPPPRPPPPRPPQPPVTITVRSDSLDSTQKRRSRQRVPPNIYYNNIRLSYKPKRRFVNLRAKHWQSLQTYDEPKPPVPVITGQRRSRNRLVRAETLNRVQQKNALNAEIDRRFASQTLPPKQTIITTSLQSMAPTPPPRRHRKAQRSQTVDVALYWQPFSWKWRRCRSLTELDVRKRIEMRAEKGPKYENIIRQKPRDTSAKRSKSPRPARPPLPSGTLLSSKRFLSDNYHIYASVSKGVPQKPNACADRPLPPPPVPPRPKGVIADKCRPQEITQKVRETRDASVSTKDNGLILMCEKQTQIDSSNHSIREDLNGNELDLDLNKTPTNPLTPTTPTNPNQTQVLFLTGGMGSMNGMWDKNRQLDEQTVEGMSDSTVTLSSITTTNWFDAENPIDVDAYRPYKDWDQDTINDDISSITSNYQSLCSDVTVTDSREQTPVPEDIHVEQTAHTYSEPTPTRTAPKPAVRSQSLLPTDSHLTPDRPVTRRSLPVIEGMESAGDLVEPNDDMIGITRELHSELRQILDKRSSERPVSTASSETSHEIMTNTNSADNKSPNDGQSIRHSSSVDSLDSQPIDSSSDGDDYSLSSANEQSPEYHKRKQQQKLYFIAKELYSSEHIFVDVLHLLNNDFRSAVEQHIPEDILQPILKLLPQLLQINEQLLKELKERIDDWPNHQRISDVLVNICPFLKQYSLYIRDFESISTHYDEALRRHPSFANAVKEFESTQRCQKLSVKHYMLKPVQRLPQYRLLLQDYLRHLTPESDDYLDTCHALQIVSQVAEHANNTMKSNENISKLLSIQNSIIGGTEIIKPGRAFIKEGELMKLSRKGMQERWFILFNDSLMYLTAVQNGVFRVNHELSLTGMRVSVPSQQDFQNEFSVISHTRSFSLAARSTKEREEWVTELNKAIKENTNKRISFAKSGSFCSTSIPMLELGNCAPVWIPDARVTMCQLCTEEFSVTFRRHHCRCCGKVVCSACSGNKAPLPYLKNRTARVCDECFEKLRQQMEEIESQKHLSASSGEVPASGEDTDEGWSLKEWRQQFARNLVRSSNRKVKHRYVPSVLKEVSANDVGSLISGYLHRRESKRNWKRYWFVIKDLVLYTYKASEDVVALKSLPLLGFKVETLSDSVDGIDPKSLFQLSHPGQPSLIFRAETVGSAERWFKSMQTATTLE